MHKMKVVVVTDCVDVAYNELRGMYASLVRPEVCYELEPVVTVKPFSVVNGAFILKLVVDAYPEGTVFSVILNPLKERPERLVCKLREKNVVIVTANTGVLQLLEEAYGIDECYEITDHGFYPFGGKYVHTPAVIKIISGDDISSIGVPFELGRVRRIDLNNVVVHIDNFGLIKVTNEIKNPEVGRLYKISIGGNDIEAKYDVRMMSNNTGEWIIYPGSSFGLLEIGKVRENGAASLNISEGDNVIIQN